MNLGGWNSVFAVPSAVVDKHIKLAGSAQLKVLLWILRHAGEPFTTETIAEALSMHPADVHDAMQYWIETGLICEQKEILSPGSTSPEEVLPEPIVQNTTGTVTPAATSAVPSAPGKHTRLLSRPQKPDSLFVAQRINECTDIASMMQEAQMILGRPISNGDSATLVMLHDTDGLPVDVILMLLQYAVSIGKNNMKYIEKMAISWAEEEIDTHAKAEHKIRMLSEGQQAWKLVERTIGIEHRSPSSKEAEFSHRWVNEWKFGKALIREAYERCVDAKGKYIIGYTDSILRRWNGEGIKTLEQARAEKTAKQQRTSGERRAPSYDIDEYERTSIFDDYDRKDG